MRYPIRHIMTTYHLHNGLRHLTTAAVRLGCVMNVSLVFVTLEEEVLCCRRRGLTRPSEAQQDLPVTAWNEGEARTSEDI